MQNKNQPTALQTTLLQQTGNYHMSSAYKVQTTQDILSAFQAKGFELSSMSVAKARKADKNGFQKHLLRLRQGNVTDVNGVMPEIVVVNSYDGSSSLQLFAGLFRMVCANGLILGKTFSPAIRIRHNSKLPSLLDLAIESVNYQAQQGTKLVRRLEAVQLSEAAQNLFLTKVADVVLPESANHVDLESLNRIQRREDVGSNAWLLLNRAQEAAIRGGIRYTYVRASDNAELWTTSRAIKAVDTQVEVNRAIFDAMSEVLG
jgi:hypothetical protein